MPRFILTKKLLQIKQEIKEKNLLASLENNSRKWLVILMIMISSAGIIYLFQVNKLATKGYEIRDLEENVSELREQNKKLELQITQLKSTSRISKAIEELEMVEVARVEYLQSNGNSVAVSR